MAKGLGNAYFRIRWEVYQRWGDKDPLIWDELVFGPCTRRSLLDFVDKVKSHSRARDDLGKLKFIKDTLLRTTLQKKAQYQAAKSARQHRFYKL